MADLNVERKAPSVWPWVIGLLVLALLVWAFVEMFEREPATSPPPPATLDTSPASPAQPGGGDPAQTQDATATPVPTEIETGTEAPAEEVPVTAP